MGWYEHWFGTRYYALLYGHRDEDDARAWVDTILGRWGLEPGQEILDMACGRGRHARWFDNAGLRVTGIDISERSISEAVRMVPNATFKVHDMREPLAGSGFDAACCLFTSLGYFGSREDDRMVFSAVVEMLRPGGRFVLDFMNTGSVLRDLVAHEMIECEGVKFTLTRTLQDDVIVKSIAVNDGGTKHQFEERVLALSTNEIESMALEAGLVIEDRSDGPVAKPFDPDTSDRFVLWMMKPVA